MVLLSVIKTCIQYTCPLLYVCLVYAFCGLTPLANLHHLICALSLSVLTPFGWLRSVSRTPYFWWACNFLFTPTLSGTQLGGQTRFGCVFMACVRPDRYSRARRSLLSSCSNVSLGLRTSVSGRPLSLSLLTLCVLGFGLTHIKNVFILMILYDFWLLKLNFVASW